MRTDWSPRVYELKEIFEPYWKVFEGIAEDAPEEVKEAYREFCELVKEEMWL